MHDSRIYDDGYHRIALPWRPGASTLRDNFEQAATRLKPLQKRFEKNTELKEKYVATIQRYQNRFKKRRKHLLNLGSLEKDCF